MTAALICHVALSNSDSIQQLWSEISEKLSPTQREGYREGFLQRTSHFLLLQSEMDVMFGFKCIFNGTASSHLSKFCRKVRAKEEERERGKKTSYQEIGNWVRRGITCHSRSKLLCVFPQRRAPHYEHRLTVFLRAFTCKRKHDLICLEWKNEARRGKIILEAIWDRHVSQW